MIKKAGTAGEENPEEAKKPRRSSRLDKSAATPDKSSKSQLPVPKTPISTKQQLPSPITLQDSSLSGNSFKEGTATPAEGRPSQINHQTPESSPSRDLAKAGLSSPSQLEATQVYSQMVHPTTFSEEVKDEEAEGVWGYLLPLNTNVGKTLVLKKRSACISPDALKDEREKQKKNGEKKNLEKEEEAFEETKVNGVPSGGYLVGRHPECGKSTVFLRRFGEREDRY